MTGRWQASSVALWSKDCLEIFVMYIQYFAACLSQEFWVAETKGTDSLVYFLFRAGIFSTHYVQSLMLGG